MWSVTGVNASYQPISIAGNVLYDAFGSQIHAYDAASGAQVWSSGSAIASGVKTGVTIVNGHVYAVDWNDTLYAFGL